MKGLFGFIYESSKRYPDKTFVRCQNHAWTYSEVESLTQKVSGMLLKFGVQKGDRVVIFCDNSIQYIAAFFGIMRINAVAVPFNPMKMTDQLLYIIEKCSPRLIIVCSSTAGRLNPADIRLRVKVIDIDCGGLWEDHNYIDGIFGGSKECNGYRSKNSNCAEQNYTVNENDNAIILFTSGTTAHPKGVVLTHGNLIANTQAIVEYLHLTSEDSILMTLPFTYSYGNSILLTHAFAGASIVLENYAAYPYKILESIKRHGVSGFSTVGSYINLMLKYIKNSNSNSSNNFFAHLRYMTFAGESTNPDDIRFLCANFPDLKVYVMYGQTEASARLSYLCPEMLPGKAGSVGKGLSNVKLRVVDGCGFDIRPGEVGEIIAAGPNVMKCYWDDPIATQEVLRDGWLYTGDSATVDEDGFIYIKGRKTDMLKHMGHRISPVEIESVLNSYGGIKESAVIESKFDSIPVIKAFIVMEKECSTEEIRKFVYAKLPVYMRPQVFEVVDQLPRTDTGKIMRNFLRRIECAE